MRVPVILAVLAAVVLGNLALWALPNRPQPLQPPPGGKLQSVSFAPFRDGQSPLTERFPTPAQIEEDMRLLQNEVMAVRTYTSREGLEKDRAVWEHRAEDRPPRYVALDGPVQAFRDFCAGFIA